MEGNLGEEIAGIIEEKFQFELLLGIWPDEWKYQGEVAPSHVRRVWGLGYKGPLMQAEMSAPSEVLEGKIVEGTAPHDRPTTQLKAITDKPSPANMPKRTVHPAVRLGKPGGS